MRQESINNNDVVKPLEMRRKRYLMEENLENIFGVYKKKRFNRNQSYKKLRNIGLNIVKSFQSRRRPGEPNVRQIKVKGLEESEGGSIVSGIRRKKRNGSLVLQDGTESYQDLSRVRNRMERRKCSRLFSC